MRNSVKMTVLTVLAALTLSACGLKGDLYMEETPPVESTADSTVASPTEPAAEALPAP